MALLVNVGRAAVLSSLGTFSIGWGTGAGSASASDTQLFSEDSGGSPTYARIAGVASLITQTNTSDTLQVVGTLTANSAKTITNAGLFTGSTLFLKESFTPVALGSGDTITFTWQWKIT